MIKHTQTINRQKPTNYLSVFDHFVGLALEGLKFESADMLLQSCYLATMGSVSSIGFWSPQKLDTFCCLGAKS